jgi:hypothetical protein
LSLPGAPDTLAQTGTIFIVTNTNDSGVGSLRQAILDANANPGQDTIAFNIPDTGPHAIGADSLPTITDPVVIDGCSQPGADCSIWPLTLQVELRRGLELRVSDTIIKGLNIPSGEPALYIDGDNNRICSNYIGTDITGTSIGSYGGRIELRGNDNLIGTKGDGINDMAGGDIIVGNMGVDMYASGREVSGARHIIAGNYIGTDPTGTLDLSNRFDGIFLHYNDCIVGGDTEAEANVIAFYDYQEIRIWAGSGYSSLRNPIYSNSGLGINLDHEGIPYPNLTYNDPGDGDSGPNDLQNFPVLTSATPTSVTGYLNSYLVTISA